MRNRLACIFVIAMAAIAGLAQQPPAQKPAEPAPAKASAAPAASGDAELKAMFEAKIKAEWDALKKKDAKAYGDLLADDYQGVENDGQGERTKAQAIGEIAAGNVFDYTLWGFKLIPLCPDATAVIYEVTLQFPPKSAVRYSRVYITELWLKRNGEWKSVHSQETHVK